MAIRYKVDIMAKLKEKGYSSTKIREEKLIGQSYLQQLRHGELVSWKTLDTICTLRLSARRFTGIRQGSPRRQVIYGNYERLLMLIRVVRKSSAVQKTGSAS